MHLYNRIICHYLFVSQWDILCIITCSILGMQKSRMMNDIELTERHRTRSRTKSTSVKITCILVTVLIWSVWTQLIIKDVGTHHWSLPLLTVHCKSKSRNQFGCCPNWKRKITQWGYLCPMLIQPASNILQILFRRTVFKGEDYAIFCSLQSFFFLIFK